MTEKPYKKLIALDFDGVLHSYTSPWTDAATISDPPTPGAMEFLRDLVEDGRFDVAVVSSRCKDPAGIAAIGTWLMEHLLQAMHPIKAEEVKARIEIVAHRPPAFVTIDDRAVTFVGEWPSMDRLAAFQPFYKKPRHLRPDPLTSVAAIDALMMRIGRVAKETGCPDEVNALEWLEERARIGHAVATTTSATIERISDEDMERLRDLTLQPGASFALPPSYWSLPGVRLRKMLETAWDAGMASECWYDEERDLATRKLDVDAILAGETARPTVDGVPVLSADELPVPERMARYAAARGKSVDEFLAKPTLAIRPFRDADNRMDAELNALNWAVQQWKATCEHRPLVNVHRRSLDGAWRQVIRYFGGDDVKLCGPCHDDLVDAASEGRASSFDVETEEVWTLDAAQPLSFVTTRQRLFHVSDEAGEPRQPGDDKKVEAIRQRQASLDREFAPFADIERLILDAVPPGTPVTRASAGGDLGWRVGHGWLSVEGSDPARPDLIRACAQSLAAIPDPLAARPRNGDPELVEKVLAAGRAM